MTLADIIFYLLLKNNNYCVLTQEKAGFLPHTNRWFLLCGHGLECVRTLSVLTPSAEKKYPPKGAGKVGSKVANDIAVVAKGGVVVDDDEEGKGTCPPLEDAIEGMVCTRFPPEPSGYLHLGHAKAVLLNQYYAQRYKGRLIVRFDDTNPSKEKEEYADNIIKDLATLGVTPDVVTHTSDSFAKLENLARRMINEDHAYMDDTDQETMQAERMEHKESVHRNTTPVDNIKIFEKLLKGDIDTRKYCLRARIDMSSLNGTMRDPVLFRYNETPHHRTGTKYKAYPTYDFACPVVDSIEGVTHALRTTEYTDRDEQYAWIQNTLKLRKVYIYSFGKMNFINTVLSKRKLNWFVEQKLVEGWFDPRFPTIQGCVRRGVNVEALKSFIIGQGASRRVITMEWDKFWSVNKSLLEESCPRYMGVSTQDMVTLTVTNLPFSDSVNDFDGISCVSVQIHPQKPEYGLRVMRQFHRILVDQSDAVTYKEGEEVTFLRWGNFFIDEIVKDEGGKVLSMKGRSNPGATNFSKTKKTTWLAAVPDLVPLNILEFDHLISKPKLADNENFQDFLNPITKIESSALGDPCMRTIQVGTVIQLERKGFFRCDVAYGGPARPVVLFSIPDGKMIKGATAPVLIKGGGKKK
mmetsp:Transcript_4746/g.4905  ORF Transcript_4746/g.4905 Transcript_4746/m.4905 type:complete len:635 (+) Transcript_4746:1-1905(+)